MARRPCGVHGSPTNCRSVGVASLEEQEVQEEHTYCWGAVSYSGPVNVCYTLEVSYTLYMCGVLQGSPLGLEIVFKQTSRLV